MLTMVAKSATGLREEERATPRSGTRAATGACDGDQVYRRGLDTFHLCRGTDNDKTFTQPETAKTGLVPGYAVP